jgi:hypothetical protein
MKFFPSAVGAERKKLFWLIGLAATAIVAYEWSTHSYDTPSAPTASTPTTPAPGAIPALPPLRKESPNVSPIVSQRSPQRGQVQTNQDFKPSLKPKEGVDISSIDPTLHLDRLVKLREIKMEAGFRSVFKEGQAPPPPPPPVSIKPGAITSSLTPGAAPTTDAPPGPPPPPPPAPIPLKFYGYTSRGSKRAFFLDGEDIQIAGENEMIRNRYKIIRIGVNSAVVEDTTDKHQQTLPLVEELTSG